MSQLGKTSRLSQRRSAWPSTPLGSGSRVIFICSLALDALPTSPRLPPPSLLFMSSFCLSLFVRISPSISVPVPVLAMCGLTDGPLFAVLSYLSEEEEAGGGGLVLLSSPSGRAEAGSVAGHPPPHQPGSVWTIRFTTNLVSVFFFNRKMRKVDQNS